MFTIRNYPSTETYDLGKFMDFKVDTYDVINSPLLNKLKDLTISSYYSVANGYKDIDRISQEVYNDVFFSFYILYYNDLQNEKIEEDVVLKLFSLEDFNNLYYNISNGII